MRAGPIGVALALLLAALACSLETGDGGGEDEAPVMVPVFDVATVTPGPGATFVIATPTLPIATQAAPAVLPATAVNCTPNTAWPLYTVQVGDTLGGIAQATGVTIDQLATANCWTGVDLIYAGQQLYVPRLPAVAPAATTAPVAAPVIAATVNPTAPQFVQPLAAAQHWYDASGRPITYLATVRVSAGEVREADRVLFYVSDLRGGGAIQFGQDVDPWDGAFADYTFPAAGTYTFQAVAQNDVARANSTVFTVVFDPNFRPPA
jgi:LysM repeat protein